MPERTVAVVAFDGVQTLDVTGPWECFAGANAHLDRTGAAGERYRLVLAAADAAGVRSESGIRLGVDAALDDVDPAAVDTLIVAGGSGVHAAAADPATVAAVARLAASARRVCSVCTGVFLLAAAGLLDDGQRVTTHWARAGRLSRTHPSLEVDADPIYLRSGRIWTSAGVTSGMDLSLALVEDDHGATAAQTVARWLVLHLRRPGGQSQFAAALWHGPAEREPIRDVQDHIHRRPDADLSVAALALVAGMSERNFTRVFTRELGEPPGRYVERVRLEAARRLLEDSSSALPAIARQCGFGTAETLRRAFVRGLGVAPHQYRQRFGLHEPATRPHDTAARQPAARQPDTRQPEGTRP